MKISKRKVLIQSTSVSNFNTIAYFWIL